MIVADTSALISLATGGAVESFLEEFDVHTTERVVGELRATSAHDDPHGEAAEAALNAAGDLTVHDTGDDPFTSSRVDEGEGSCAAVAEENGADFLLTDDLRALPELKRLTSAEVAISPVALKALAKRGALTTDEARDALDLMAEGRDWLESPIYRRAEELLEE